MKRINEKTNDFNAKKLLAFNLLRFFFTFFPQFFLSFYILISISEPQKNRSYISEKRLCGNFIHVVWTFSTWWCWINLTLIKIVLLLRLHINLFHFQNFWLKIFASLHTELMWRHGNDALDTELYSCMDVNFHH